VSQDLLLQVFFMNHLSSPKPLKITLGPFQNFSKICGDIRKSRCTTGINDTGCKFAAGVNYTRGKCASGTAVLFIPMANSPQVSTIPAADTSGK
jgi:hypothetical protein